MTVSNGSFITSKIPQASNVAPTDRVLVLWNAANVVSVGNGSCSTRTVTVNNFLSTSSNTLCSAINFVNSVTFSASSLVYIANAVSDNYILANTNGQAPTITLPSAALPGKCFTIKKTIDTSDVLTVNTNAFACKIDGATAKTISSPYGVLSLVKGDDGCFYVLGTI